MNASPPLPINTVWRRALARNTTYPCYPVLLPDPLSYLVFFCKPASVVLYFNILFHFAVIQALYWVILILAIAAEILQAKSHNLVLSVDAMPRQDPPLNHKIFYKKCVEDWNHTFYPKNHQFSFNFGYQINWRCKLKSLNCLNFFKNGTRFSCSHGNPASPSKRNKGLLFWNCSSHNCHDERSFIWVVNYSHYPKISTCPFTLQ